VVDVVHRDHHVLALLHLSYTSVTHSVRQAVAVLHKCHKRLPTRRGSGGCCTPRSSCPGPSSPDVHKCHTQCQTGSSSVTQVSQASTHTSGEWWMLYTEIIMSWPFFTWVTQVSHTVSDRQ
jgi:hypothetical protein